MSSPRNAVPEGQSDNSQSAPLPFGNPRFWRVAVCVLLAAGTLAAFSQVLWYEFVEFDDGPMIVQEPRVNQGLTWEGLRFAFTGPHMGNLHPLTTLSHQLDCALFGIERPGLHHLVNLVLHLISVLVLFEALRRMTEALWPSAMVAALFAIHPLHVESVAWIAERKDVLSGLFFMLTLLAYAEYARRGGLARYLLVTLMLILGLASKPMLVTLPCVLLLLDWWPLARGKRAGLKDNPSRFTVRPWTHLLFEKLPWLATSLALSWITWHLQHQVKADYASLPWSWRMVHAPIGYSWYLWKTFWPTDLCALYLHPALAPAATIRSWMVPSAVATLAIGLMTAIAVYWRSQRPYLLVGWFWFLGMLVPVIGLLQVGSQAYADRYAYLPLIGIYLLVTWTIRELVHAQPRMGVVMAVGSVVWLAVLTGLTWRQVSYWHDSEALLGQMLRVAPDNAYAHFNLGNVQLGQEKYKEAIDHYSAAVGANPGMARAYTNMGVALQNDGRPNEAIQRYQEALRLNLDSVEGHKTHYNLGRAFQSLDRLEEAIAQYQRAIQLNPRDADAHHSCGVALAMQQQYEDAEKCFRTALRIRPDFEDARADLERVKKARQQQR